jgi:hypothetical protein
MKDETKRWLDYADENLRSAKLLLDNKLFNPCLQNVQQAVEKMLKAILAELAIKIKQYKRACGNPCRKPLECRYNRGRAGFVRLDISAVKISSRQCSSRF